MIGSQPRAFRRKVLIVLRNTPLIFDKIRINVMENNTFINKHAISTTHNKTYLFSSFHFP